MSSGREVQLPGRRLLRPLFFAGCALFFFLCMALNLPRLLAPDTPEDIDPASSGMMVGDLLFARQHEAADPLARRLEPRQILSDGTEITRSSMITEFFLEGKAIPAEDYTLYESNLCVHHLAYRALDALLPIGDAALLALLKTLNQLLMALTLAGVMLWAGEVAGHTAAALAAIPLGLASPTLLLMGENLYWAGFSLFLPMAVCGAVALGRLRFSSVSRYRLAAFLAAFLCCLFKQLFYFEYISCTLVAMMVPFIVDFFARGKPKKGDLPGRLLNLTAPAAGGLLSFVAAIGLKVAVLSAEPGGFAHAWQVTVGKALQRTHGAAAQAEIAAQGAEGNLGSILKTMLAQPVLQVRSHTLLTFGGLLVVLVLLTFAILLAKKFLGPNFTRLAALAGGALLALAAPLSWFLLASGHTAIHTVQSGVCWYLPFAPMVFLLAACLLVTLAYRLLNPRSHPK